MYAQLQIYHYFKCYASANIFEFMLIIIYAQLQIYLHFKLIYTYANIFAFKYMSNYRFTSISNASILLLRNHRFTFILNANIIILNANIFKFMLIYCAITDLPPGGWERMRTENDWDNVNLRDKRYHQVIHLVS